MTVVEVRPEIIHPVWCQPDRCRTDGDIVAVVHKHVFGVVAGIEVAIERTDIIESGKVKHGPVRTYSDIQKLGRLTAKETDRLARLANAAAVFAGQRMGGSC